MNKLDLIFAENKKAGKKPTMVYLTAGDPSLTQTASQLKIFTHNKADIVEIGIPFSDPIAESPQIQNASKRAIENGATLVKIFDTIKDFRKNNGDIAIILSLYINTIFAFGADKFFSLCDECNISALAVPDLPFEEQDEILPICNAHGIYLLSQTTNASQERAKMIAINAKGILLCTFCKGTTPLQQQSFIAFLRENTNAAIACGNEFV